MTSNLLSSNFELKRSKLNLSRVPSTLEAHAPCSTLSLSPCSESGQIQGKAFYSKSAPRKPPPSVPSYGNMALIPIIHTSVYKTIGAWPLFHWISAITHRYKPPTMLARLFVSDCYSSILTDASEVRLRWYFSHCYIFALCIKHVSEDAWLHTISETLTICPFQPPRLLNIRRTPMFFMPVDFPIFKYRIPLFSADMIY